MRNDAKGSGRFEGFCAGFGSRGSETVKPFSRRRCGDG